MQDSQKSKMRIENRSEIILNENKYSLIDKIGDGYKATVSFDFSEDINLNDNSIIEVLYEYWYDEKRKRKKVILNTIRTITLFLVAANFILSFVLLGAVTFWF